MRSEQPHVVDGKGEPPAAPHGMSATDLLAELPYPDRPDNHFKVDPAKWDYYSMDIHRMAQDNAQASDYATSVINDNIAPDGTELSPMRIAECRLTLAFVAEPRPRESRAGLHLAIERLFARRA